MNFLDALSWCAIGVGIGGSGRLFWAAWKRGALSRRVDLLCGWVFGASCAVAAGLLMKM